jgi:hypothetical protein
MNNLLPWVVAYAIAAGFILSLFYVIPIIIKMFPAELRYVVGLFGGTGYIFTVYFVLGVLVLSHITWTGFQLYRGSLTVTDSFIQMLIPLTLGVLISFYLWHATQPSAEYSDPNALGPNDMPLIHWTVTQEDIAGLNTLIGNGADVDAPYIFESTVALRASLLGLWEMTDILLQNGAQVDIVDGRGMTIPYFVYNNRYSSSYQPEHLEEIKARIEEAGITHWKDYHPQTVKIMLENNTWPPLQSNQQSDTPNTLDQDMREQ